MPTIKVEYFKVASLILNFKNKLTILYVIMKKQRFA